MRNTDPRTLQLWPAGDSATVRGDSHGPKMEIKPNDLEGWRLATAEERRRVQIEEMARGYHERAVLCCDSCLVDALLQAAPEMSGDIGDAFSYEEIENLYPSPQDWTAAECKDWLEDLGHDLPDDSNPATLDRDDLKDALENLGHDVKDDETVDVLAAALFSSLEAADWGDLDDWRNAVTESDPDPAEIFEWWRIDSFLCAQLRAIGEPVLDNDYGYWWGRTCTGQGMLMDGTLQKVAAQFAD